MTYFLDLNRAIFNDEALDRVRQYAFYRLSTLRAYRGGRTGQLDGNHSLRTENLLPDMNELVQSCSLLTGGVFLLH